MITTYTEAEAKRKYCPLKDNAGCVTSYCMKWEWETIPIPGNITGSKFPPVPKFEKTDRGYCGL